jgi:drug/metabolite transporter (DMT)-like permease
LQTPATHHTIPPRALALLAVLTLVWGTNWTLFPLAVQEVSVWTFRALALPVAGLTLLMVAGLRGLPLHIERRDRPTVLAAALAYLVVWNIASTYAAVMIPSGQAAVLGFTMPLWAAVISTAFSVIPCKRSPFFQAIEIPAGGAEPEAAAFSAAKARASLEISNPR